MGPAEIKTLADVRTWLKHHVEWSDLGSEDCAIAAVAALDASALAAAPLAPTGGGGLEHLEEAALLLSQYFSDPGAVSSGKLYAWLEAERARKAGK